MPDPVLVKSGKLPATPTPLPSQPARRLRKFFLLVAGLGLSLTCILTLVGMAFLLDGALRVKAAVSAGESAIASADLQAASQALQDAVTGFEEMQSGYAFLGYLKPVPWVGDQIKGMVVAVDTSLETIQVILTGLQVAEEVLTTARGAESLITSANGSTEVRSYSELSDTEKSLLLSAMAAALPDLREMQVRLRLAQADLDRLDERQLAPVFARALEPLRLLIPELLTSIDVLVPFAAIAPEFGGIGADKQFLILYLNDTELRPGGGFIGVYGLMVIRDGQIVNLLTSDSYHLDALVADNPDYHVNPPPPLVTYLSQAMWYFRDAAWSPDFEQTARDAVTLLRQETAAGGQPVPEIHGVVGITPTFIARLLKFIGPVTVEGQTFSSANIADLLEYQVEQGFAVQGVPLSQRKDIVGTLTNETVDRVLAVSPATWPSLLHILHEGFAEKELAFMSFNEHTQAVLKDNDWAGVLNSAGSDDILLTVDANLAALKTDPVVERHVNYSLEKHGTKYRATARINYTHRGNFDWKTTRYRTYTRLYVPLGSTLVASSGSLADDKIKNPDLLEGPVSQADEFGMTSFGAFIAIEPGQSGTLSFTYDLPDTVTKAIERGTYRLLAIKQMGAGDNLLTLNLDFDTTLASAEPPEKSENFGDDLYQVTTVLNQDRLFTVRLD